MIVPAATSVIHYPDSDGEPMADNTLQFDWIAILKWNADAYLASDPDAFVAGDNLIYPVENEPDNRMAPDVYVAFGRPKGYRGSYKVWEEGGIFPQVVFEVWSPNNRYTQMQKKFEFYEKHGAEEYYIVYPEFPAHLEGWTRDGGKFREVESMDGWVSPRLGFRFALSRGQLAVFGPDGRQLRRPDEIAAERDAEQARAEQEAKRAEQEAKRAEQEAKRAEQEAKRADEATRRTAEEAARADDAVARAEKLAARLRELGLDPDAG